MAGASALPSLGCAVSVKRPGGMVGPADYSNHMKMWRTRAPAVMESPDEPGALPPPTPPSSGTERDRWQRGENKKSINIDTRYEHTKDMVTVLESVHADRRCFITGLCVVVARLVP